MRKWLLPLLLTAALPCAAQATDTPAELVRAGVALYDGGHYDEAVAKYQQALRQDPADQLARAELALTYNTLGRYAEAVALGQQLLQDNPRVGANVYASLGNSLDGLKKPAEAMAAYRQGIRLYPGDYNLHFNLGVTQVGQQDLPGAVLSFEQAVRLNPRHASSHMLLGAVLLQQGQRIPGLLALARFLVLEPGSPRSAQRREWLDQAMTQGVSRQDANHVTINISASSLGKKAGTKGDDFGPEEMLLSLVAVAPDSVAGQRVFTPMQQFVNQFGALCRTLGERQAQAGRGFVRTYYAPYFVALEQKGFVPAFAYLAHRSQADAPEVAQWLAAHPTEVQVFQEWSKTYTWPQPEP